MKRTIYYFTENRKVVFFPLVHNIGLFFNHTNHVPKSVFTILLLNIVFYIIYLMVKENCQPRKMFLVSACALLTFHEFNVHVCPKTRVNLG